MTSFRRFFLRKVERDVPLKPRRFKFAEKEDEMALCI